ncbi:MAG TPA: tetratricopeptide repeat protein [Vulgatibacter sp.]|nr:tetratricopeptide repeat protein [Vulgatibacter sp.]
MNHALVTIVGILALGFVLPGCESSVNTRLERARQLSFAGKAQEAAAEYRVLLAYLDEEGDHESERTRAARVESLARYGDLTYLELRDYRSAAEAYRMLIAEEPAHEEAWAAREKLADLSKRFLSDPSEAIAQWQALAESGRPEGERFAYLAAKAYFEQQQYEQARKECAALAERAPGSKWAADALFLLATAWQFEGENAQAVAAFEEVERRWPDSEIASRARFQIGEARLAMDDPEAALASYLEALKRHPDPQRVQAEILRARRRLAEAQRIEQTTRAGARG